MADKVLNLIVIDEEQLYAEKLVGMLSHYFDTVNLGFWDEKAELVKALRSEWDVLIFNRAYDMTITDVVGVLQEHKASIPIIQLTQETALVNELGLPQVIDADIIKTLAVGQDEQIVLAVCLLAAYSQCRRQSQDLQGILQEAELRANILIDNSKSAVAYVDEGVHVYANEPYLEMFGYASLDEIIGVPVVDLIAGADNVKAFKQLLRKFAKGDRSQVEFDFQSKTTTGETFESRLQLAAATYESEPVVQVIIQRNELGSEELARQLAAATRQDPLTGLANRTGFNDELTNVHSEAVTHGTNCALLYISIDDIGKINSSAGLLGVDNSVKYIANLLSEVFSDGFVARFSDATFAVLLSAVNKEQVLSLAEEALKRTENALIEVGNRTVTTTLSIGVVMIGSNAPAPEVLLGRAIDTALAVANDNDGTGNAVRVFDISAHADSDDTALVEYMQTALTQNRFKLSYQPAYDINSDTSDLFEVYITLPLADGSELSFDKFAPIAKKHNLLDKIDRWQLINASKALAITRKTHPQAKILLSLSSVSLADANLAKMVTQLTKALGDAHDQPLWLQFYEGDLVDYLAVAKRQFMALNAINCPAGITGFGITAKSEDVLSYLSPTTARLARSYTKNLDREENMDTVKALVAKAREQHCDVLMPYIEDAQMMTLAWSIGARYLQGYYLQMPSDTPVYAAVTEETP